MTETNKVKFLLTTFQLTYEGMAFDLKGLASEVGITKIQVLSRPPPHIEEVLGKTALVQLGSLAIKAVLVKHFADASSFYEVRFLSMHDAQKAFLLDLLETDGVAPGWMRKHPRIPVKQSEETGLPTVTSCMMRFLGREEFVRVVNFSVGGVRIQVDGTDAWKDARVGMTVHFDLLTNSGEVMPNFSGEIRNISLIESNESGEIKASQTIGISFTNMDGKLKHRLYDVIRIFCQEVLKRIRDPKAPGK